MRTQWTIKGNRDAGSSCLCDRGLHRYLRNFGGGVWTPQTLPPRYATDNNLHSMIELIIIQKAARSPNANTRDQIPRRPVEGLNFLIRRPLQHVTFLSKKPALSPWHYSQFTNEGNTWEKILPFNLKIYVVLKRDCWVGLVPQPLNPRCIVPATPPPPGDPTPLSTVCNPLKDGQGSGLSCRSDPFHFQRRYTAQQGTGRLFHTRTSWKWNAHDT